MQDSSAGKDDDVGHASANLMTTMINCTYFKSSIACAGNPSPLPSVTDYFQSKEVLHCARR
jgi:hypothetical protein